MDNLVSLRSLPLSVVEGDDAKAQQVATRESDVADIHWTTRWFDGLTSGMFVVFEGSTYKIIRRREIGRRAGWEIWAKCVR